VHAANIHDVASGCKLFEEAIKKYPSIQGVVAKRWAVERTFVWLNHFHGLSRDYEVTVKTAENMVMMAHTILLAKRLSYP
jgi:putative transposase